MTLHLPTAVSQYRSGMSYSRIGKLQGVSTSEVKAALRKELGWIPNTPSPDLQDAVALYVSGANLQTISQLHHIGTTKLRKLLDAAGVKRRPPGRGKGSGCRRKSMKGVKTKPYWEPTLAEIEEGAAQIRAGLSEEELIKRAPYLAIVPADTHVIAESDIRAGRRGGVKP